MRNGSLNEWVSGAIAIVLTTLGAVYSDLCLNNDFIKAMVVEIMIFSFVYMFFRALSYWVNSCASHYKDLLSELSEKFMAMKGYPVIGRENVKLIKGTRRAVGRFDGLAQFCNNLQILSLFVSSLALTILLCYNTSMSKGHNEKCPIEKSRRI